MGPAGALDSLRKALAMGADRAVLVSDERRDGLGPRRHVSRALAAALERESADLVLFGQQASDSDGAVLWAAVADRLRLPVISQVAELTVARRQGARQAPDRVRLRPDRGAAPGGRRRLRRDQRAALPVAEGDHGREEEAAGDPVARRPRARRAATLGEAGSRTEVLALGDRRPRGDARKIEDDGSARAADRRVPGGEEAAVRTLVFLEHHDGGAPEGLARRARQGGVARRRRRGRRRSAPACSELAAGAGRYGAAKVYVADDAGARGAAAAAAGRRARAARPRRGLSTPCSSRPRCWPPTSPPASPRGSTPA